MDLDLESELVNSIANLAQRKPIEIGGFILRPTDWVAEDPNGLKKPPPAFPGPKAAVLKVATLGALRDYLTANRDGLKLDSLIVHIETPNRVTVGSALRDPARDRELYITEATDLTDAFIGKFLDIEEFNIGLQVRFCDADQRTELLRMTSSVKTEQTKTAIDDGMTQTLEARAGVHLRAEVSLPNPVQLTPFRTFRDIPQPSSPYAVRATARQGGLPQVALFEADGGTWKLSTIGKIRDWLIENLPADVTVLA